jgi:endonuclease YncB( thermonuclease family)
MQFKFTAMHVGIIGIIALLAVVAWSASCHWHRLNELYYDFKYRNYDMHSFPSRNRIIFKKERSDFLNDIEVWAKIVKVNDGDTYSAIFEMPHHPIGMYTIRLRKVDTPELNSKNRNEQINAYRCEHLMNAVLINKTVQLVLVGKDNYERMIADVRINDTMDLGEFLIKNKYGKVLPRWLWMRSQEHNAK